MAAAVDEFTIWLGNKLQALNTDENVFGSYITGILDGDETVEEKTEAIEELLREIIESDISLICKEIIDMWQKSHPKNADLTTSSREDVDEKLVRLLESQSLATTVQREYTAEEKKIRDAILAQYSQMTDDEDELDEKETSTDTRENGLERNTNAQAVQQAEKEKREQAKMDSQKKKDKDKEDREKQKQLKEEKKEKRKTQKGERRR